MTGWTITPTIRQPATLSENRAYVKEAWSEKGVTEFFLRVAEDLLMKEIAILVKPKTYGMEHGEIGAKIAKELGLEKEIKQSRADLFVH